MKLTPKVVANAWLTANPDSKARIEVLSRVKNRAWGGNPESFVVRKNQFGVVDNPPGLVVVIDLVDKKVFEIEPGYSYNRYDAGKLRFENTIAEYPLSDLIETEEHQQVESGKLELIDQRFDLYIKDAIDPTPYIRVLQSGAKPGHGYARMYRNFFGQCTQSVLRELENLSKGVDGVYLNQAPPEVF